MIALQARQRFRKRPSVASQGKVLNADVTKMHADNTELNDLSGRAIGCAFAVLNTPGAGRWKMCMRMY